jgi:predicted dienelactone hydrolase
MGNGLRRVGSCLLLVATTLVGVAVMERSTIPAERINFNYSLLGFNLKVKDLATFAETGEVSDSLNYYFRYIQDKQTQQLRKFLRQSYDVDPVLVYRYSRTSAGIKMLQRIGEIIQLPGNINGFYGLRAALVQTAQSPEGINFVDFLQRFPTDVQLNLKELLQLVKQVTRGEKETKEFIASLAQQKVEPKSIQKNTQKNAKFRDLSQPGNYQGTKQTLEFYDRQRDRHLITDLYLPQKTDKIPIIVVSNGLGAKRDRFEELARYLVSRGFGVVIPEHPGSNHERQKAFVKGLYQENFDATEYLDRPLDISYVLDQLEQLNGDRFQQQLNLKQVGFFGYSIGGITGLSLAGAKFDLTQLAQDCAQPLNLMNISILYQCRALELPKNQPSLKDDRIKAVYTFVPFGHSLFGKLKPNQIDIPIMFQVVDQDFLTSLLDEQIPLFNSLGKNNHLIISEKLPHSNVTLAKETQSSQSEASKVAKTYQNLLSLIFFQSYIVGDSSYLPYLSSAYLQAIAHKPYNLHLLAN